MASPRVVLAAATAAQVAGGFFNVGLPAIGPQLREAHDLTLAELGILLAAPHLGSALSLLGVGVAIDRFGSRITLLTGTTVAVAALLVAATASSTRVLIPALAVAGAGSATLPVAGIGALFRAFPPERRGRAIGIRHMGGPGGGIVAAAVAPVMAVFAGVDLVLFTTAGILVSTALCFAAVVGDDGEASAHRGLALRAMSRLPGFWRLMFVVCLLTVVVQGMYVYSVPSARAAGLSALAAGVAFFAVQVTMVITRAVCGTLADRGGGTRRVRTLVEVSCIAAAGAAIYAVAPRIGAVPAVLAAVVFAFGAGGWNSIYVLILGEMGPQDLISRTIAFSITLSFGVQAGAVSGLGFVADNLGFAAVWSLLSVFSVAAAGLALGLRGYEASARTRARSPTPPGGRP